MRNWKVTLNIPLVKMIVRAYHCSFLLFFIFCFVAVIESKNDGGKAVGETDTFIAAVYEHLPFLALPVCYEKGKLCI